MILSFTLPDLIRNESEFEYLARLLYTVEDGWHDWHSPDPDAAELRAYYDRHPGHEELLAKSFVRANAYGSAGSSTAVIDNGSATDYKSRTFTLADAVSYLTKQLEVVVENRINDGKFFLRFFSVVDRNLVSLFKQANPPVRFEHGGGKNEISKIVEDRFHALPPEHSPARLLALVDSDAKFPGHADAETNALRRMCERHGVRLLVLKKRMIENYVASRHLKDYAEEFADLDRPVGFILSLSAHQRNHYHMKAGLTEARSEQEGELYAGIDFPSNPPAKLPRLMEYYLGLPDSDCITADLIELDCLDEFREIASAIREEL